MFFLAPLQDTLATAPKDLQRAHLEAVTAGIRTAYFDKVKGGCFKIRHRFSRISVRNKLILAYYELIFAQALIFLQALVSDCIAKVVHFPFFVQVVKDLGLCITLYDVQKIDGGFVFPGDGAPRFTVSLSGAWLSQTQVSADQADM